MTAGVTIEVIRDWCMVEGHPSGGMNEHADDTGPVNCVRVNEVSVCYFCFADAFVGRIARAHERAWQAIESTPGFDINLLDDTDEEAYYWRVSPFQQFVFDLEDAFDHVEERRERAWELREVFDEVIGALNPVDG